MTDRLKHGLAFLLVIAASIGGSVLTSDRLQQQRDSDLVAACQNNILDRLDTIKVRETQAVSDGKIARDPFQSVVTRAARARESAVEWASARDQTLRVDPAHGGRLDCYKISASLPSPKR